MPVLSRCGLTALGILVGMSGQVAGLLIEVKWNLKLTCIDSDDCISKPVAVDSRVTHPAVVAADHTVSVFVMNSGASYSVGIGTSAKKD